MAEVFEDKLMDLQGRIVSTCLEALESVDASVDATYIYGYWTKSMVFFNVFFAVDGNVTHSFDADYGYDDLEKSKRGPYEVFQAWKDKIAKRLIK